MTAERIIVTNARGESFADVARRTGEINGQPVDSDATDDEVLNSFAASILAGTEVYKGYPTKAAATADLASIPANAFVEVFADEGASPAGANTVYQKVAGALVLALNKNLVIARVISQSGDGTNSGGKTGLTVTGGTGATDIAEEIIKSGAQAHGIRIWQNGHGNALSIMADGTHEDTAGEITAIADNGSILTQKWMVISGSATDNGFAWNDKRYLKTYQLASAVEADNSDGIAAMLSVFADTGICIETRPATNDPPSGHHLVMRHGIYAYELTSFDAMGRMWTGPGSGATDKGRAALDANLGRIGKNSMGMTLGAFRPGGLYTKATCPQPADAELFAIVRISDGDDGDGLYANNGTEWRKITLGATSAGVTSSGFGWTSTYLDTDGGAITATGTKTFEKTAGIAAWTDAVYSLTGEKITGDQEISFTILNVSKLVAVGFNSGSQPAGVSGGDILRLDYGVLMAAGGLLSTWNGTTQVAVANVILAIGDRIRIRIVGGVMSVYVTQGADDLYVGQVTGIPNLAYWVEAAFNEVNAKVGSLRHRAL